jgi:hypothetical protein
MAPGMTRSARRGSRENGLSLGIVVRHTFHNPYTSIGLHCCGNQNRSVGCGVWIEQDTNLGQAWHELLQQLNPFSSDSKIPSYESSNIATGVTKAFHQSKTDGINNLGGNDWMIGMMAVNWRRVKVAGNFGNK